MPYITYENQALYYHILGVIVSSVFRIGDLYFGPIWCGILFHIIGFILGVFIMKQLRRHIPLDQETVEL